MAISSTLTKQLQIAVCSQSQGNTLADLINKGEAAGLASHIVANVIVATNVSQTIDFASLAVGDKVVVIPAAAGNSNFVTVAVAGTLGQAAVVGSLYIVLRAINLPAASAVVF